MEPLAPKDELKSVTTMPGALSVMTSGLLMMQLWPVGNLDSIALVNIEQSHSQSFQTSKLLRSFSDHEYLGFV